MLTSWQSGSSTTSVCSKPSDSYSRAATALPPDIGGGHGMHAVLRLHQANQLPQSLSPVSPAPGALRRSYIPRGTILPPETSEASQSPPAAFPPKYQRQWCPPAAPSGRIISGEQTHGRCSGRTETLISLDGINCMRNLLRF